MKQLVYLILWICLVIDDSWVLSDAQFQEDCMIKTNSIHQTLEKIFDVQVKQIYKELWPGCINNGSVYETDDHKVLFVKDNRQIGSHTLFRGEFEGLKAIRDTKTVYAPRPLATGVTHNGRHILVMDYLNITKLDKKTSAELGRQIADMHMCNWQNNCGNKPAVKKFGFHVTTSCGIIPQNNTWNDDWITFFIQNRMEYQIEILRLNKIIGREKTMILEVYWPKLKKIIPSLFEGVIIKPSLVHGDMWFGNVAKYNSKPIVFDPAAFYGHNEYDIASTEMFSNYADEFYEEYYKKIPKVKGYKKRLILYQLYHHINTWNHVGGVYEESSLDCFDKLLDGKID